MAFGSRAQADDLNLGGNYGVGIGITGSGGGVPTETAYGGSVFTSTLNSVTVPWVYCVDLLHTVFVPGDYNATTTTLTGIVNGGQVGGSTAVSDQIAYLLVTYAASVAGQQNTAEGELQAAIWKLEYGSNITINSVNGNSSAGVLTAVANYVTDAQTNATAGERADVTWLSPRISGSNTIYQGLVTNNPNSQSIVPEPSTFAIAGLGALGFMAYGWKRRKRS